MEQFREVYIDRQKALGNPSPVLPKAKAIVNLFKDKETVFQLALEAALRKPEKAQQLVFTTYEGI